MAQMEQEGTAAKPSKKPLIILIVAVILSLAAGAGGMFFYMKQQAAHEVEAACEPEKPVVITLYNELSKPLVVNFPQNSSVRLVKITLSFATGDEATIGVLKKNEPMIMNNLLMLISGRNTDDLKTHEGKIALRNAIFDDVTDALEKTAPGSEIKEVFFTSFIMQ